MSDQLITNILLLVCGSLLTLAVTYVTQLIANKTERKKIIREKIEEAYIVTAELNRLIRAKLNSYLTESEIQLGSAMSITSDSDEKLQELFDKVNMLINFYIPSMKPFLEDYDVFNFQLSVFQVREKKDISIEEKELLAKFALSCLDNEYDLKRFNSMIDNIKVLKERKGIKEVIVRDQQDEMIDNFILWLNSTVENHFDKVHTELKKLIHKK